MRRSVIGGHNTYFRLAGQIGLSCGDSTDNEFDDFTVLDIAGPYVIDARWFHLTRRVSRSASLNYPHLPQVVPCAYPFDPDRPPGARVSLDDRTA